MFLASGPPSHPILLPSSSSSPSRFANHQIYSLYFFQRTSLSSFPPTTYNVDTFRYTDGNQRHPRKFTLLHVLCCWCWLLLLFHVLNESHFQLPMRNRTGPQRLKINGDENATRHVRQGSGVAAAGASRIPHGNVTKNGVQRPALGEVTTTAVNRKVSCFPIPFTNRALTSHVISSRTLVRSLQARRTYLLPKVL